LRPDRIRYTFGDFIVRDDGRDKSDGTFAEQLVNRLGRCTCGVPRRLYRDGGGSVASAKNGVRDPPTIVRSLADVAVRAVNRHREFFCLVAFGWDGRARTESGGDFTPHLPTAIHRGRAARRTKIVQQRLVHLRDQLRHVARYVPLR
jgi:hypothetical protein